MLLFFFERSKPIGVFELLDASPLIPELNSLLACSFEVYDIWAYIKDNCLFSFCFYLKDWNKIIFKFRLVSYYYKHMLSLDHVRNLTINWI